MKASEGARQTTSTDALTDEKSPKPLKESILEPMKTLRYLTLAIILVLCGCKSNVTTTLQIVVAAAEAAVGTLEATRNLSPEAGVKINAYLTSVSQATSFAATELATADTSQVKALKISQQFASIAPPNLPAGPPQTVLAVVQSVTGAVLSFLQTIQPAQASNVQVKITTADITVLKDVDARAQHVKSRVQ